MSEKVKISGRQIFFLVFCSFLSSSLFGLPNILITQAKQDAWLTILVGLGFDAIILPIIYFLGLRYPNQTMYQYSETILGKYLGKLVGLVFVTSFLIIAAIFLRIYVDFIEVANMPETPTTALAIVFLIVSTYAVDSGLEVIGRISELLGFFLLISVIVILPFTLNIMDVENLLPVLQHSPIELIKASLFSVSWMGLYIVMGVFMAYHEKPEKALKAMFAGIGLAAFIVILTLLLSITVLGVDVCIQQLYPFFRAIRMIQVGDFFERLDSFDVIFWLAGSFVSLTVFHYSTTLGLAQLLKLKRSRFLSSIVALAIFFISIFLFHSTADRRIFFMSEIFLKLALSVEIILPVLLLIVSLIKHRKISLR